MRISTLLLLLALSLPASAQSPIITGPAEDVAAVQAVLARWGAARDVGDIDAIVAEHDPDMLIMTRNAPVYQGHDGVRAFYSQFYAEAGDRQLLGDMRELVISGDLASLVGRFLAIDAKLSGGREGGWYLVLLRRNAEGAWKVWRDIDTPSPDGLGLEGVGKL